MDFRKTKFTDESRYHASNAWLHTVTCLGYAAGWGHKDDTGHDDKAARSVYVSTQSFGIEGRLSQQ